MSNVNITINGDITVYCANPDPSELEAVINELADAVIEDEDDDSDESDTGGFYVALIVPDEIKKVFTYEECADFIDKMESGCEFYIDGECFNLVFERKGLMTCFDENFLVVPAFALFHDEQTRAVSGDAEMLNALEDYIRKNSTEFRFGEDTVAALRLEGGIVEGV